MKKKLMVLLVLVIGLVFTGCSKDDDTEKDLSYFFSLPTEDFTVCEDGCISNNAVIDSKIDLYKDIINEFEKDLLPDFDSSYTVINNDELYDRESIQRYDPVTGNQYIPISYTYRIAYEHIFTLSGIARFCDANEDCYLYPINPDLEDYLGNWDYKYNDTSAYYEYEHIVDDEIFQKETFRFSYNDDFFNYEYKTYIPSADYLEYANMTNGIYISFEMSYDELKSYYYIDINNNESFVYYNIGDNGTIRFYDYDKEFYYFTDLIGYEVAKLDSMEYLAGLSIFEEEYTLTYNFHFMDGWNKFIRPTGTPGEIETYYLEFFNDDIRVFEDKGVFLRNQSLYYTFLDSKETIETSNYNTAEMPEEFNGNVTMDELRFELEYFSNLEDPFMIIGFTQEEFNLLVNELYNSILDTIN